MGKTFTQCFHIFSPPYISSLIQKRKLGGNLFNQQTKYKLCKSQNYLHDCYYSISKTKTYAKWTKRPINSYQLSYKKEPQKIGDSSNTDRANARKCSI